MSVKIKYIIIPVLTFLVALLGSAFTGGGMDWYKDLALPSITPSGSFIGLIWTIIFILTATSALMVLSKASKKKLFYWIFTLFLINAFLNVFWSYLFFGQHLIFAAIIEMILLEATVLALIILIWPVSFWAALLLFPYAFWVIFATYLAVQIFLLN